jgi:DNA-binding transcriptional LysR family regulator
MKLRQLQILDVVARHLSVTGAANELGLSQPAVSLQLKLLEQEYQKTFLKRTNRGVEITEQGQKFLDAIRPVLLQINRLENSFRSGQPLKNTGMLVVGGSHTLSVTILPEVIVAFQRTHPSFKVELETRYSPTIEEYILNARIEVGLISSTRNYSNCVYEAYKEHPAVAFVAPNHPLAGRTLNLRDLSQQSLVVRKDSSSISDIVKLGYPLNLVLQCDAPDAVKTAVRKGIGVGILFRSRVDLEISTGELCEVDVPELKHIVARSSIVYDRRRPLSTGAQDFLNLLRELKNSLP